MERLKPDTEEIRVRVGGRCRDTGVVVQVSTDSVSRGVVVFPRNTARGVAQASHSGGS